MEYVLGNVVLDLFAVADRHEQGRGLVVVQAAVPFDLEERVDQAEKSKVSSVPPDAAKVVASYFGLNAVTLRIDAVSHRECIQ